MRTAAAEARVKAFAALITERKRQIAVEGWTAEHDDAHDGSEMLRAAIIYYQNAGGLVYEGEVIPLSVDDNGIPLGWPWSPEWWKPKTPERDLIRAGALCLAEKERRLRATPIIVTHPVDHKLDLIVNKLAQFYEESPTK